MVSFSICNAALALKKQHVLPLKDHFEKERASALAFQEKRSKGELPKDLEHRITADFQTFPGLTVPNDTLKSLVYEGISSYGRSLALVAVLEQSLVGLSDAMRKRNDIVHRFASGAIPAEHFAQFYFGLPLPNGNTDKDYPDVVEAIYSYVDDIAFFSSMLCADLIEHGEVIRKRLVKISKKNIPKVSTADFSTPKAKDLIPKESQYADWLSAFTKYEDETKPAK